MNYLKIVLCMMFATSAFSMQQEKLTIEPINQNLEDAKAKKLADAIENGIEPSEDCPICALEAITHPNDVMITKCCQKFICTTCVKNLETEAIKLFQLCQSAPERAAYLAQMGFYPKSDSPETKCPLCMHVPLEMAKTKVIIKPMQITDHLGASYTFTSLQAYALEQCGLIKEKLNDERIINFKNYNENITINGLRILANYIINPKTVEKDAGHFVLAHLMQAPENILYLFSNNLWNFIQPDPQDIAKITEIKTRLRAMAEPYLHCPAYLLLFIKDRQITNLPEHLDLSYFNIKYQLIRSDWVSAEDKLWYFTGYKFRNLKGLKELVAYLQQCKQNPDTSFNEIILNGHALTTFSLQEIGASRANARYPQYSVIHLSDNRITTLDASQFEGARLPATLNLQENQITQINDTIYDLRSGRSGASAFRRWSISTARRGRRSCARRPIHCSPASCGASAMPPDCRCWSTPASMCTRSRSSIVPTSAARRCVTAALTSSLPNRPFTKPLEGPARAFRTSRRSARRSNARLRGG